MEANHVCGDKAVKKPPALALNEIERLFGPSGKLKS
jgi:hypothetical protein